MNADETTLMFNANHAEPCQFMCLSTGDWIQLGILVGLIIYVIYTARMSNDNRIIRENTIRPVVGINLNENSKKEHIGVELVNYSKTDAMGLLSIELHVNDGVHFLGDESYEGKKIWYFPALQGVTGHKEFSAMLKTLEVIADPRVEIRLVAYLYYKIWNTDKKEIKNGRKYYSPVKRWVFKHRDNKWIGELTSKSHLIPPEPDWDILSK